MSLPRLLYPVIAGVGITKAAIAGEHMRPAFFNRVVLAVPSYDSATYIYDRAPWSLISLRRLLVERNAGSDNDNCAYCP